MKRIALFGAGAEVDLGLSCGNTFTRDTFYRSKTMLYDALRNFYENRLDSTLSVSYPKRYIASFLLQPNGSAFRALVENIVKTKPDFIEQLLGSSYSSPDKALGAEALGLLYKELIAESDSSDELWKQGSLLSCLPSDIHFGILERYYSELITPGEHPGRLWKLINFYWSAFFSIALPICDRLYGGLRDYGENRYDYVLKHLNKVIRDIFNIDWVASLCSDKTYYGNLRGAFDGVITTNYTPYSCFVADFNEDRISRLSGSLSTFEELSTLRTFNVLKKDLNDSVFAFPYMMCQSPVKPIVDSAQLCEYSKAINFLSNANELVVIGYSFCREDAHIASIVSDALRDGSELKLKYFSYDPNAGRYLSSETISRKDAVKNDLLQKLRLEDGDRVSVDLISSCQSDALSELV